MKEQYITRKCTFDSGHRIMNEQFKCFNQHGHTYICELEFEFNEMEEIGYAIDFKEIKRIGCQWIDDYLDHGMILNPKDDILIKSCLDTKSKYWLMSLNGKDKYCNPSVENIAKEIFLAMSFLFKDYDYLTINKVILWETPNCYTICKRESISEEEGKNWIENRSDLITRYTQEKGILEYDDRK